MSSNLIQRLAGLALPGYRDLFHAAEGEEGRCRDVIRQFNLPQWQMEYNLRHCRRFSRVISLLRGKSGERVLEIGAMPYGLTILASEILGFNMECATSEGVHADRGVANANVSIARQSGEGCLDFPQHVFNCEEQPWPVGQGSYSGIIMSEVFEHLMRDPYASLVEANRALVDGGWFLMTTPNAVSLRAIFRMLDGDSAPLCQAFGGNSPYYRHHREYTALQIRHMLEVAGFSVEFLRTIDLWAMAVSRIPASMAVRLFDKLSHFRGEFIFAAAFKSGDPIEARPVEYGLYRDEN